MQARQNIAKKTCIEIYKSINSLITAKNQDYLGSIAEDTHFHFFAKKMQESVEEVYGINRKDFIYNKNCRLSDDIYYWIINSIDDIGNYQNRNRYFSTSIAIYYNKSIVSSAIINHEDGSLLTAIKGEGSLLENTKLRCEEIMSSESFISNIYDLEDKALDTNYEMVYTEGSVTSLSDLAKGDYDFGIFENIKISDIASSILVCRESGYIINSFDGTEFTINDEKSIIIYRPSCEAIVKSLIKSYS